MAPALTEFFIASVNSRARPHFQSVAMGDGGVFDRWPGLK